MPRRFKLIVPAGEVEAIQITPDSITRAETWTGGVQVVETDPLDSKLRFVALNIPTQENGVLRAEENWWVIRKPSGTFEVMGPERFANTYELVTEDT